MRRPIAPLRSLKYEVKLEKKKKSASLRYKHAFFCETSDGGWTAGPALCPIFVITEVLEPGADSRRLVGSGGSLRYTPYFKTMKKHQLSYFPKRC